MVHNDNIFSVAICGIFIDKVQWITKVFFFFFFCDAELLLLHNARQIFSDLHMQYNSTYLYLKRAF